MNSRLKSQHSQPTRWPKKEWSIHTQKDLTIIYCHIHFTDLSDRMIPNPLAKFKLSPGCCPCKPGCSIYFFSVLNPLYSLHIYIYIKLQFPYDTHGYFLSHNTLTTATAIPSPPFHSSRIWAPPPVPRPQSLVDQKRSHTKPGGFLLGKKGT